ncbi:hypothetical protein EDD86DRAFT_246874 [Gorgonomyces haynaldii]|nr:hypothetical protein EDD86DRAFT_246874 [Gorgonomyces haynaldii]
MISSLLSSTAMAHVMVTSQWHSDSTCSKTAPDVIYTFYIDNLDASEQRATDYWPYLFVFPYSLCGQRTVPTAQCCYSLPLHIPDFSHTYAGSMSKVADIPDPLVNAPKVANGNTYCRLVAGDESSVFGYQQALFLANNECQEGSYICSSTGVLSVYFFNGTLGVDRGCQGLPIEQYQLAATPSQIVSGNLGSFTGSVYKIESATQSRSWIGQIAGISRPRMDNQSDIWGACAYGLSLVLSVGFSGRIITRILKKSHYGKYVLTQLMVILVATGFIICSLLVWLFPSSVLSTQAEVAQSVWMSFASQLFLGLVLLQTSLVTNNMLIMPLILKSSKHWIHYVSNIFLVLIHIGLDGSVYYSAYYTVFLLNPERNKPFPDPVFSKAYLSTRVIYKQWALAAPYYLLFVFIFNSIPPVWVSLELTRHRMRQSLSQRAKDLHKIDPWSFRLLIVQICCGISYLIFVCLRDYTDTPGGDLSLAALSGTNTLILTLHVSVSILIAESMQRVSKRSTDEWSNTMQQTNFKSMAKDTATRETHGGSSHLD